MGHRTWRAQLALVWIFGIAVVFFLLSITGVGGVQNGIGAVYAPLPDGVSIRGSLTNPFALVRMIFAIAAWLVPFAAAYLAWRGRRLLRAELAQPIRERLRAGTIAVFVIALLYLTPVGWTLVYGLTRWTIQEIWGEGPLASRI